MNYIDQHMHSSFSFDSEALLEDYLRATDNLIVSTEHLDLEDPTVGFIDRPLSLPDYFKTVDLLNEKYHNRLLRGLEVGWSPRVHERILSILKSYEFDLILLSLHHNGEYDYMNRSANLERDPEKLIPTYLDLLYQGVEAMGQHVNVMAHFDYGFRVVHITAQQLEKYGKRQLVRLFNLLIENDTAFEINTSSIVRHNNLELYQYALGLYLECGGKLLTLGSDAHFVNDYQRVFGDAVEYLDSLGIEHLTYYIGQRPHLVSIKSLL